MPRAASSRANLAKADYELLADFRYTLRKFFSFSEAAAARHGVSPQQYQALLAIEGFPGKNWVTVGELAERLQIAHHSAVGLIDRMETMRLVHRAASKEDRRKVQVSLSPKGLTLFQKLYREHHDELQTVAPQLVGILRKATEKTLPAS